MTPVSCRSTDEEDGEYDGSDSEIDVKDRKSEKSTVTVFSSPPS